MIDGLRHLFHRVRSVFRRAQFDSDLDTELAFHLELAIEENIQHGMPVGEARRQALIRFGGTEQTRLLHREARALPALDMLFHDLRYAVRGLFKNPGFTIAAVLTLALGIAVNATMFSLVSAFLLRRPPVRDPERVAVVSAVNPAPAFHADASSVSAPNYLGWREANHVFEDMAAADEYRTVPQPYPPIISACLVSHRNLGALSKPAKTSPDATTSSSSATSFGTGASVPTVRSSATLFD